MQDTSPAPNPLMDRLARRQPALALGVRHARTTDIARYAHATGHHVVWVDLEHSAIPIDAAGAICATASDLGLVPFVRMPENDLGVIGRVLDAGAQGIIAPRIESAQQALAVAQACRFPPQGHRSAIASLPQFGFRRLPPAELFQAANRAALVQILVESPAGVENAEAILAVDGVDMLAVGTNDLCAELGVPGDFRHPRVRECHEHLLAACIRAGKPLVVGGIPDAGYVAQFIERGAAPFLFTGMDGDLLLGALHERAAQALASVKAS